MSSLKIFFQCPIISIYRYLLISLWYYWNEKKNLYSRKRFQRIKKTKDTEKSEKVDGIRDLVSIYRQMRSICIERQPTLFCLCTCVCVCVCVCVCYAKHVQVAQLSLPWRTQAIDQSVDTILRSSNSPFVLRSADRSPFIIPIRWFSFPRGAI